MLFLLGKLFCCAPEPCPTQGGWHPGASLGSMGLQHLSVSSQEGPRSATVCGQSLHKARGKRDRAEHVLLRWVCGRKKETAGEKLMEEVALDLALAAR